VPYTPNTVQRTIVYQRRDKYDALASFYTEKGLEPSLGDISGVTVKTTFLPDTRPKTGPDCFRKYYSEGGTNWPDRIMLEATPND
jgi:hypothetical protein